MLAGNPRSNTHAEVENGRWRSIAYHSPRPITLTPYSLLLNPKTCRKLGTSRRFGVGFTGSRVGFDVRRLDVGCAYVGVDLGGDQALMPE